MDNKPCNNAYSSLIHHRILSLVAETDDSQTGKGGVIEFTITTEGPDKPLLKADDTFSLMVSLSCTAKRKEDERVAFSVACKCEGSYQIFDCPKDGITTQEGDNIWHSSASQLLPIIAQYLTEVIGRMGYKNIQVPSFMPKPQAAKSSESKRKAKTKTVVT